MAVTVLIVDDHAGFRSWARELLEADGYRVIGEAESGVAALFSVDQLNPEVVLLDVALPDSNGFEVADRMAGGTRSPAIVLVSSRDRSDYGSRIQQSPAVGFIAKSELSGAALRKVLASL
jgi:DNA-binding NarL/FixJ family response regulator